MITPELRDFCQKVLAALENPANRPHWFDPAFALCTNAGRYDQVHETIVYSQLSVIFDGEAYPFNKSLDYHASYNYNQERYNGLLYENQERLAFLKKYAGVENDNP